MKRLTDLAHDLIREVVTQGETAIDATAGNGFDTLFLAELVGESGSVFAFDVQAVAIERTRAKLDAASISNTKLLLESHANLERVLPAIHKGNITAIMFNLGYLPRGEKSVMTTPGETLSALETGIEWLRPEGIITVMAYRGHPGGEEEYQAVHDFVTALDSSRFMVTVEKSESAPETAPVLFAVRRRTRDDG